MKVNELGIDVTLECEISKDGLKVEWYKGEKKLRRDDKYEIVTDGKVHRLVISKVTAEDGSKYSAVYEKLKTTGKLMLAGKNLLLLALFATLADRVASCTLQGSIMNGFDLCFQYHQALERMITQTDW